LGKCNSGTLPFPQPVSMTRPLRVALTGGIGCGKSTVADMFAGLGVPVIDSDTIAHELVRAGKPAFHSIVRTFGQDVLNGKGNLDRVYLRTQAFQNPDFRRKLEAILHPLVYETIELEYNRIRYHYCIIVIPLLVETGAAGKFDRILIVDIDEKLQVQRASQRDSARADDIVKIIRVQATRKERVAAADDIITNNGDILDLKKQVTEMHRHYLNITTDTTAS